MYPHTPCQVPGHSGPAERRASAFPAAVPPLRAARRRFLPPQCSCRRAHCAAAPPDRAHGGRRARLRFQPDIPPPPPPPPSRGCATHARSKRTYSRAARTAFAKPALSPHVALRCTLAAGGATGAPPPPSSLAAVGPGLGEGAFKPCAAPSLQHAGGAPARHQARHSPPFPRPLAACPPLAPHSTP